MPIDINLIKTHYQLVKASEEKRFKDSSMIDKVLDLDKNRILMTFDGDNLRKNKNKLQKQIGQLFKEQKQNDNDEMLKQIK
jgi:seryl-tRNA synthetase